MRRCDAVGRLYGDYALGRAGDRDPFQIATELRDPRHVHSFVRRFPQYGLISGVGRGRLALYERRDELNAMWAKLNNQHRSLATMDHAKHALEQLKATNRLSSATSGRWIS